MAPAQRPPDCRRCLKPKPSVEIVEFSAYGIPYKIPLCKPHVESLEDDFDYWIRLADEQMPVAVPRVPYSRADRKVETARLREATRLAREDAQTTLAAQLRLAEIKAEQSVTQGWVLTDHAEREAKRKNISLVKVFLTVLHPTKSQHASTGADVYFSKDCRVVVDPETKDIIDVWTLDDKDSREALTPERIAS